MTSKRIKKKKKKKTSRLLLFCCCLKIERKNYIQKQTISKTHDEFFLGGYLYKKRERETSLGPLGFRTLNKKNVHTREMSRVLLLRTERGALSRCLARSKGSSKWDGSILFYHHAWWEYKQKSESWCVLEEIFAKKSYKNAITHHQCACVREKKKKLQKRAKGDVRYRVLFTNRKRCFLAWLASGSK